MGSLGICPVSMALEVMETKEERLSMTVHLTLPIQRQNQVSLSEKLRCTDTCWNAIFSLGVLFLNQEVPHDREPEPCWG